MFTKQDTEFDEMAADPIRRRAKIADLCKRRTYAFWPTIMLVIVLAVGGMWSGEAATVAVVLLAASGMKNLIQIGSDLRLLRVIERLQKDKDEKTTT